MSWFALAEACGTALAVRLAVRVAGVPRVARWLSRPRGTRRRDADIPGCLAAAAAGATCAAHPTCLYRALVAVALLARRGQAVQLHLGARTDPAFAAHAWLTVNGRRVHDDGGDGYTPLWRSGSGAPGPR